MDPSLAILVSVPPPPMATDSSLVLHGAWLPMPLPYMAVPPQQARAWVIDNPGCPSHQRLRWALSLDPAIAWRLLDSQALRLDREAELVLANWWSRELAAAKLPAPDGHLVIASRSVRPVLIRRAWQAVRDCFAALAKPPWHGPVLVRADSVGLLARPVLPVIDLGPEPHEATVERSAALFMRLFLTRLFHEQPIPAWLQTGLIAVAEQRAQGLVPSPRGMLRIRQDHGLHGFQKLVRADQPDTQLALAWCAMLTHSRYRAALPSLLDLIRAGLDADEALRLAYGHPPAYWLRYP